MAAVLVTGASGSLGRHVVAGLLEGGHDVRALVHRQRVARPGVTQLVGDLRTGAGVAVAAEGVDTVVHCASSPGPARSVDIGGARHLLGALRSTAPNAHFVYISIAGVSDDHPYFYYRAKAASEALITASDSPWTILRATQFYELIVRLAEPFDRLPFAVVPDVRIQPMAAAEAAARLVELVDAGPSGRVPDIAGPEVGSLVEYARDYRQAIGKSPRVKGFRLRGRLGRAAREEAHIPGLPGYGRQTWSKFLAAYAQARSAAKAPMTP